MTHKHKRIADIYFALLHELAHCKTDFNKAQATSLISYESSIDECEQRADHQAYNWMVDDQYYNDTCCKSEYNINMENYYPKCFVLYRFAKDKIIKYECKEYQKYNILLKESAYKK